MSWTPDIWIKEKDFKRLEKELSKYDVWEFNIASVNGFVLSAGVFTQTHRELHDFLEENNCEHWLIDSHNKSCDNCKTWGKQIYEREE